MSRKYFRTKRAPLVGAGSTARNEPRELSTENSMEDKLGK